MHAKSWSDQEVMIQIFFNFSSISSMNVYIEFDIFAMEHDFNNPFPSVLFEKTHL